MLHGKYKEDFNCRHCELAYKRVKEWAEKAKFDSGLSVVFSIPFFKK